jgi:hypothetical protein
MARWKWWIIALSLALLAACVGVWKWSEPPYAFMGGARLWRMQEGRVYPGVFLMGRLDTGGITNVYVMPQDTGQVWAEIKQELGAFRKGMLFEPQPGVTVDVQARSAWCSPSKWFGLEPPEPPPHIRTVVEIYIENPTFLDRVRLRLFERKVERKLIGGRP